MSKIIQLDYPYAFLHEEMKQAGGDEKGLRDLRKGITVSLFTAAMAKRYPEGISISEGDLYSRIYIELSTEGVYELDLDDAQVQFVRNLLLSDDARKTIRFKPEAAPWVKEYLRYLDNETR